MLHAQANDRMNETQQSQSCPLPKSVRVLHPHAANSDRAGRPGNQATLRLLSSAVGSGGVLQRKCSCDGGPGSCTACERKEEEVLQRRAGDATERRRGASNQALFIQRALAVSSPGDMYEQEAE